MEERHLKMTNKVKTITIGDVAKKVGVSKSTVSQYINHRYEYMGEQTKLRIEEAIKELGYQPNILARSLKQKTSKTIGVILANIAHDFSTQVVRSIEEYCNSSNYNIIVCNAEDDPIKERNHIDMLRAKQIDGIITLPTSTNVDIYKDLASEKFPMVFIDREVPNLNIRSVMLDNKLATQLAVNEFHEHGYKRIGFLTTSIKKQVTPRIERLEGFAEALKIKGLEINDNFIKGVPLEEIPNELNQMMNSEFPPEAILAGNDLTLIATLKYIKEHKLSIPDDIALIGIDDVPFAPVYYPELTTISQPTSDMGKKAAELLMKQITGEEQSNKLRYNFKPNLIRRSSC